MCYKYLYMYLSVAIRLRSSRMFSQHWPRRSPTPLSPITIWRNYSDDAAAATSRWCHTHLIIHFLALKIIRLYHHRYLPRTITRKRCGYILGQTRCWVRLPLDPCGFTLMAPGAHKEIRAMVVQQSSYDGRRATTITPSLDLDTGTFNPPVKTYSYASDFRAWVAVFSLKSSRR